jgi:hypothetical protein
MFAQDHPGKVIRVPAGSEEKNCAAWLQPGERYLPKEVMNGSADGIAPRFIRVLDQIVEQKEISATAGDRSSAACRVVRPAGAHRESVDRLRVRVQLRSREDRPVERICHDVADAPSKVTGELLAVSGEYDALLRRTPHEPRREVRARKQTFSVPWGNAVDFAASFATLDGLELLREELEMPRELKAREKGGCESP